MKRAETPDEIKRWLLSEVERLWPVAGGSISLRRSPCIRPGCALCARGEGHPAHVLQGKRGGRRFGLYVPEELAGEVEAAIERGRQLRELIVEAGERYAKALKQERQQRQKRAGLKGRR
jgi:hypothetical protein